MTAPSLTDRLLIAITSEKQDALANGTDGTPRVRQRLDAMVDALGIVQAVEEQATCLSRMQDARPSPTRFRDWMTIWTHGRPR